jgi:hypothetical protein
MQTWDRECRGAMPKQAVFGEQMLEVFASLLHGLAVA